MPKSIVQSVLAKNLSISKNERSVLFITLNVNGHAFTYLYNITNKKWRKIAFSPPFPICCLRHDEGHYLFALYKLGYIIRFKYEIIDKRKGYKGSIILPVSLSTAQDPPCPPSTQLLVWRDLRWQHHCPPNVSHSATAGSAVLSFPTLDACCPPAISLAAKIVQI